MKTNLIIGIIGIFEITYFLIRQPKVETVFGFQINGWVYFTIWLLITLLSFRRFFMLKKENAA